MGNMRAAPNFVNGHRRASSTSTVRATTSVKVAATATETLTSSLPVQAALWVHDDNFSQEEILVNPAILTGSRISEGSLVEISLQVDNTDVLDFEDNNVSHGSDPPSNKKQNDTAPSSDMTCLCIVKYASPELLAKHQGLELSVTKTFADAFKLHQRTQVVLKPTRFDDWTASHIELSFRDAYLARSDMWRLVSQELSNKVIYKGQKIAFLGTMKLTIKEVHIKGHRVSTGFFSGTTIPIFRSEAARYVLFIQMSQEMWDFDSEGNGEIMFNRVINGFLPDLFRRWANLEVRHLVSIVMFGRLEYGRYDFGDSNPLPAAGRLSRSSSTSNPSPVSHQDFYRVVVTDMASAQWTTILHELKKDFQVFLRDLNLHTPVPAPMDKESRSSIPKIRGRPSTALKGNILEAINLASSQFANDYIDRDLIRTGVSTVIVTAGSGVFDVDRDLLNLTSENLTNNGIGIDVVCLSKMPLHSVPLFRYRLSPSAALSRVDSHTSDSSHGLASSLAHPSTLSMDQSSALSSFTGTSVQYFSRFPSAFPSKVPQPYGYGIPHWIDLSYWSPSPTTMNHHSRRKNSKNMGYHSSIGSRTFVPRVRMYELQMMGLMELGMADISIPYLAETRPRHKRPRHQISMDFATLSANRSLSQSPSYLRKGSALGSRQKEIISVPTPKTSSLSMTADGMDEYDNAIFRNLGEPSEPSQKQKKKTKQPRVRDDRDTTDISDGKAHGKVSAKQVFGAGVPSIRSFKEYTPTSSVGTGSNDKSKLTPPRISRSISYALRGLPASFRSSATTDINVEAIKALPSVAMTSLTQANAATPSEARAESIRQADIRDADTHSVLSSDSVTEHSSKPILIAGFNQRPVSQQVSHKLEMPLRTKSSNVVEKKKSRELWDDSPLQSSEDEAMKGSKVASTEGSVPQSTIPFIRNVNASNPLKRSPASGSIFGRWQHLYPHKPRASTVKWRSLCTPASVPLTTEDFPTSEDLLEEYDSNEHRVLVRQVHQLLEKPVTLDSLLYEMVVLRLSHGYQIIIGDAVRNVIGNTLCETSAFLDPTHLSTHGDTLVLCMGNTIQKLYFGDSEYVHVTKYVKRPVDGARSFSPSYSYLPNIRTILSTEYATRTMELKGFSEEFPWALADNYLANGELDFTTKVNKLRYWRARFVLLPIEPPANTYKSHHTSEDNEEEVHLLGIRALTQMWQKARYFAPSERKTGPGRMGSIRRRDQNPLEVKFDTLNMSELVTTELDKLLMLEEAGEVATTQLLPDSERLDREVSMAKLAHAIQGEKGIEIKNRRWHLRLHYNCFNGEEFTNWLLHNVKNIETRDEAVEFGDKLMNEGLFEHVNSRHTFKDGHYFYSLKPEFKMPRLDVKGSWFSTARRQDKSVPPTPISEHPSKDNMPITTRSRSGSSLAYSLNPATPLDPPRTLLDRKKKTVTLTKMIKLDVDPRKRSSRAEIINLHYDRFHNPENCYHIELSWLNTTSKLVDDMIVSWTNQAERYGLKLVEVPIPEASRIPEYEPFRRAFPIKLAVEPPKRQAVGSILTSNSFTAQPHTNPDKHVYQKAILKRFNFVLDLEGRCEFPENVDVIYSSSGLEYKYTQFVHRSGVCLAQITHAGEFLLLANRLYNARLASSKEANNSRYDSRNPPPMLGPGFPYRGGQHSTNANNNIAMTMSASGIMGLNVQSPRLASTTPSPSPMVRASAQASASADVFGSRSAISNTSIAQYVTPEQIKDELAQFCSDAIKLEQFYREHSQSHNGGSGSSSTTASQPGSSVPRRSAGTSSSALKPIQDANEGIPEFVLPESISTQNTTSILGGGLSGLISRRNRPSVAYDSVAEMFGRAGLNERVGGEGSRDRDRDRDRDRPDGAMATATSTSASTPGAGGGNGLAGIHEHVPSTTSRSSSADINISGRNSANVTSNVSGNASGNLELRVRVDTPGGSFRIEEGIEELRGLVGSPRTRPRS